MTYVIGISHQGNNSILADQRITRNSPDGSAGENNSIKIGALFPGCIFGATGNIMAFSDFLLAAKYHCRATEDRCANWKKFLEFVEWYRSPTTENEHFAVLLSRSDNTELQWFIYDSASGLKGVKASVLTLGKGKESLDAYIEQYFDLLVRKVDQWFEKDDFSLFQDLSPYLFAYYFSQLSTMTYRPAVERLGVGGVFTFVSQNIVSEYFQKPSLYIFADYDKKKKNLSLWMKKLWFEDNWLIITSTEPPSHARTPDNPIRMSFVSNDLMQPTSSDHMDADLLASKIQAKVLSSTYSHPPAYFQAIGYCDPIANPRTGCLIGYGAPLIVNSKGQLLEMAFTSLGISI